MIVSERKLAANRRNALKSTGPKTPYGKFRSSRNAVKHGRYAHLDLNRALEFVPPEYRSRFIAAFLQILRREISSRPRKRPS